MTLKDSQGRTALHMAVLAIGKDHETAGVCISMLIHTYYIYILKGIEPLLIFYIYKHGIPRIETCLPCWNRLY